MLAEFSSVFLTATRDEWADRFEGTDACVSPVLSMTEAMKYPVNTARGVFVDHDGVRQAAPAPRFSVTPGEIRPRSAATMEDVLADWADVKQVVPAER